MSTSRMFVITGGPGAGKTTLLEALERKGFTHMPEAGRAIIRDQRAIGGPALPWADRRLFAELMLGWELRSHRLARAEPSTVFLDRGVPDLIGYLRLEGLPVPGHFHHAAQRIRYHPTVFLAPHWPAIHTTDAERRQSPEIARRTEEFIAAAYRELGYRLVTLPLASVDKRVEFVRGVVDRAD